jgi:hypothetical protein
MACPAGIIKKPWLGDHNLICENEMQVRLSLDISNGVRNFGFQAAKIVLFFLLQMIPR